MGIYMSPYIYLISRISNDAHLHTEMIVSLLNEGSIVDIFVPHKLNPTTIKHNTIQETVFLQDLNEIKKSTHGIICFPIGNDCSAEIGWFAGACKPVIGIIVSSNDCSALNQWDNLQHNWMVKGFISKLIVYKDKSVYNLICQDDILKNKSIFVDCVEDIITYL